MGASDRRGFGQRPVCESFVDKLAPDLSMKSPAIARVWILAN
jgi:hypothetical protein